MSFIQIYAMVVYLKISLYSEMHHHPRERRGAAIWEGGVALGQWKDFVILTIMSLYPAYVIYHVIM